LLSPKEWEERKAKLLKFLRENPDVTKKELIEAGYESTLKNSIVEV
jgi:hypothetical protein